MNLPLDFTVYYALHCGAILLAVALIYIYWKQKKHLILVCYFFTILLASIISCITGLTYNSDISNVNGTALCWLQGVLINYTTASLGLWPLCVSHNLWLLLARKRNDAERKFLPLYITIAWGIPFF